MIALWTVWFGCGGGCGSGSGSEEHTGGGSPPGEPARRVVEMLDLNTGKSKHFDRIPAAASIREMTTSSSPGNRGHRASGTLEVTWDDGEVEAWNGALPVVACSRGYRFELDGMHGRGAIRARGPRADCAGARVPQPVP